MTQPSEPRRPRKLSKSGTSKASASRSGTPQASARKGRISKTDSPTTEIPKATENGTPKVSEPDDVGFALLLTKDEAGLNAFRATLLPGNRILVRDLPFERLGGICPGEVSVLPPPGSDLPVRRAQPTGTFAHRATEDAPTVTAIITLATAVADVRVPEHLTTEKHFAELIGRHDGDLHAGLAAEGMRTALLTDERVLTKTPRKITCTPPDITIGGGFRWSLCSWLGIFC